MNRTLKLRIVDQVSTLDRVASAFVGLQYNINELYVKPASEDDISDTAIKVRTEDEDVYRILITKLKKQVSVINIENVND